MADEDQKTLKRRKGILVSVLMPVYNAEDTLDECLLEISVFDDASTDKSFDICRRWKGIFEAKGILFKLTQNSSGENIGPGAARNKAYDTEQSTGEYLCTHDADDISFPNRIEKQLEVASTRPYAIIGCCFDRLPKGSTTRYTEWHNNLTSYELELQQYRELTLAHPTWFMKRTTFERVGGYATTAGEEFKNDQEVNKFGLCEDMKFFFTFLEATEDEYRRGKIKERLYRVPEILVTYRYTSDSMSSQTPRKVLLRLRVRTFEKRVLTKWKRFTIWGAGRDGKNFFNELKPEFRDKQIHTVYQFCDIDEAKIKRGYYNTKTKKSYEIVHFRNVTAPFVVCVAKDRTDGQLEANVNSLSFKEGEDYFYFT